jgi:enterochelin esterase-like enzyme
MQDSVEIFLDEKNDKTVSYGPDDLHFRVNYENVQSIDNGDGDRFFTAAVRTDGGYVIEARVALAEPPANGKVLGFELQVNDGVGTERVATLNVFDTSGMAWNDTSKFGALVLAGKQPGDESGPNPYDLMSLIERTLKMNFKLYKNPNVVTEAVMNVVAAHFLGEESFTQAELDEQYASILAAIDRLEMTEEAANEKHFKPLPGEYRMPSDKPGSIERLHYKTKNPDGGLDEKKVNVYLPYGYDPDNADRKYNVLYLMHGGGENEDLLFGGPGENRELKNILDNMIAKGELEPLIVVTPTFNGGMNDVALFHDELVDDILPLVETTYHTYAASGSPEDLKASRAHRAFGGFSMGSVTTWHVFVNKLDYFKYFVPLSGDSWALGERSGGLMPRETAAFLAEAARKSGYAPQDYYIFSATGDLDIAYPNLKPQVDAMRQHTDVFIYSSDKTKGNFYFLVAEGGSHAWNWQNQYLYGILPDLFD